ncbi:MAG: DUF642 domain-containing protein [Cyanobacteria bacterium P01_C01_bin.70]
MKTLEIASSLLCATTLFCALGSPAAAANLVTNGSFEEPGLRSGSWKALTSEQVDGWTATQGSKIEIRNNKVGTAYEGSHFVELDNHGYDKNAAEIGLFQDILTKVGQQYTLSFAYGPREQRKVDGDNLLSVSFGDIYEELDAGNSTDGWKTFSQTFTATDTTTRLKFLSLGKRDTLGANIDDVSVVTADVPEPASLLGLAAIGAVAAGGALKKKATA